MRNWRAAFGRPFSGMESLHRSVEPGRVLFWSVGAGSKPARVPDCQNGERPVESHRIFVPLRRGGDQPPALRGKGRGTRIATGPLGPRNDMAESRSPAHFNELRQET